MDLFEILEKLYKKLDEYDKIDAYHIVHADDNRDAESISIYYDNYKISVHLCNDEVEIYSLSRTISPMSCTLAEYKDLTKLERLEVKKWFVSLIERAQEIKRNEFKAFLG